MTELTLPFEVKRLIYDHIDLSTLKSMRLVSHSWAAVGIELLLLPTFVVKSSALDISRLLSIGSSPAVARHAARIVRTINFHSNDWDPVYLRSIVCSRHVHFRKYEVIDFVPTLEEQAALSELDTLIARTVSSPIPESTALLTLAFRSIPHLQTLHISRPNPFTHPLLRRVWDEYSLETYRHAQMRQGPQRLLNILSAAQEADIVLRHFRHEQFNSNFFLASPWFYADEDPIQPVPWNFGAHLHALRSLHLVVNDVLISLAALAFAANGSGNANENSSSSTAVHQMISATPHLEELSIKFQSQHRVPFDFVPGPGPGVAAPLASLHSFTLSGVPIDAARYLAFLTAHAATLRRLCIANVELRGGEGGWKAFLERVRDVVGAGAAGGRLERFQLAGLVKWAEPDGETWLLWPIYREDWAEAELYAKERRTRDVERFVVDGAEWPMGEGDDISHLFS
ncbi:unnamed protein product [Diplocarpon coronariae]